MTIPRIKITLKWLLVLIGVLAAYLAGLVSNRQTLNSVWSELDSAQKELALEYERTATAEAIAQIPVSNSRGLGRVEKLLDELDAYEKVHARSLSLARRSSDHQQSAIK